MILCFSDVETWENNICVTQIFNSDVKVSESEIKKPFGRKL
jgi:hypothetical protein